MDTTDVKSATSVNVETYVNVDTILRQCVFHLTGAAPPRQAVREVEPVESNRNPVLWRRLLPARGWRRCAHINRQRTPEAHRRRRRGPLQRGSVRNRSP